MNPDTIKSNALLFLTAAIWGSAFVAQRVGMDHVGPFTFNGVRFALGSLSLVPLALFNLRRRAKQRDAAPVSDRKTLFSGGAAAGVALYLGASLQQVGLVYTTAGKAGFITGLYVVIVPIMGLLWRQRPDLGTWLGAIMAAWGLYLLSITRGFSIAFGDLLVLVGAFFWAAHVHILARFSPRVDSVQLALCQFVACSVFSLITAAATETIAMEGLRLAAVPIFYGGVCSVGVAYTLQVVAQRKAHPTHAAIILSLEAAFAALAGWVLLGETLSMRGMTGCALMLAGMLLSQFQIRLDFLAGPSRPASGSGKRLP
jgi:drug/metabolite transporter (DMT)-like permease